MAGQTVRVSVSAFWPILCPLHLVITVRLVIDNKLTKSYIKIHTHEHTTKSRLFIVKCRIQKGQGSLNIKYKNDIKVHSSMRCKEIRDNRDPTAGCVTHYKTVI